ncbi:MAG: amidohydrolase [Bacteroidetes bacterium]|nr:MAG: amidohydrolase [Bacteroidota bacterium]
MDKNILNTTIIQTSLAWEDIDKNLENLSQKINEINQKTDLIILPEMFSTGFSMKSKQLAEGMNGKAMQWLKTKANKKNCVIIGSLIIVEDNNYYNRLICMYPDGKYHYYDKRHLFRMGNEHQFYVAGDNKLIIKIKKFRIRPLVCYDLRFPVWSRNANDYDVLIYVANWPESRREVWNKLLLARAIENQSYVVAVNRIGTDATGLYYSGDSKVINAKGIEISKTKPHEEAIETIALSLDELNKFRKAFPVDLDADKFKII